MNTTAPLRMETIQQVPAGVVAADLRAKFGDLGFELFFADKDMVNVLVVGLHFKFPPFFRCG